MNIKKYLKDIDFNDVKIYINGKEINKKGDDIKYCVNRNNVLFYTIKLTQKRHNRGGVSKDEKDNN